MPFREKKALQSECIHTVSYLHIFISSGPEDIRAQSLLLSRGILLTLSLQKAAQPQSDLNHKSNLKASKWMAHKIHSQGLLPIHETCS